MALTRDNGKRGVDPPHALIHIRHRRLQRRHEHGHREGRRSLFIVSDGVQSVTTEEKETNGARDGVVVL